MSLKQELDELAEACVTCADKEGDAVEVHLKHCGVCQDYSKKAEELNHHVEVLKNNAREPEEERYMIIRARIISFLQMDAAQRRDAISNMLDAFAELTEDERITLAITRTKVMLGMNKEQRDILFDTMKSITADWDKDRKAMELRAVNAATEEMPVLKKIMIRKMYKKVLN